MLLPDVADGDRAGVMASGQEGARRATLTDEQFGQGLPEHEAAAAQTFTLEPLPALRTDKPLLIIVLDGLGESQ